MKLLQMKATTTALFLGFLFIFSGWNSGISFAENGLKFEIGLDNLPSQKEGNMIRDKDGFLWFCYYGGVARYDGYEVKYYEPGENSISGPAPISIVMDDDGILWILTKDNGLNKYDKDTDTFTHYKHDPSNINSISSNISDSFCPQRLFVDQQNRLLIGTMGGFDIFDPRTHTFTHYFHDPNNDNSLSNNNITAIIQGKDGLIWIGTAGGGLNSFDEKTNTWTHFKYIANSNKGPASNTIWSLLEDRDGILWVGTWNKGLSRLNKEKQTFTHFQHDPDDPTSLGDNKIYYLYEDSTGNIWICHKDSDIAGIEKIHKEKDSFVRYAADTQNPSSISTNYVSTVYEDPEDGIFWVMNTNDSVFDKHDKNSRKFMLHQHSPQNPTGISGKVVLVMNEDSQERLWVSVVDALNLYDPKTGKFTPLPYTEVAPQMGNLTIAMCREKNDIMWMLSMRGVLTKFNTRTQTVVEHFTHDPSNPNSIMLFTLAGATIIQDKDDPDILWLALTAGLEKFDKKTGTFTHFVHNTNNPTSITRGTVWSVYDDDKGYLWVSTFGGLNKFNKQTKEFQRFIHNPEKPDGIGFLKQSIVFEDSFGNFWVAGFSDGMDLYDRKAGTFKHFNKKNGFPATGINQTIQEDSAGNLWIGTTDAGLIKFDIKNQKVVAIYDKSDGLQDNHFWRSYKTKDGQMWFGGGFGVNSFYPEKIEINPKVPPIVLTSFTQGGKKINLGTAPERLKNVSLGWKDNFFEFQFAAINYTKPEKNQYAYMLEGRDNQWYYSGRNPSGRYTGLEGGTYLLRLKGSNNDGVWNEDGTSLLITVTPPFWKTSWFYSLFVICVVCFTFFVIVYVNKLKKEILDRKRAEEDLRITLHSIGDAVISTDTSGCITQMNPIAEQLTGWSFKEANDKPLSEIFHIVHSETRTTLESPVDGVLSSGEIVGLVNGAILVARSGNEYQIAHSGSPIYSESGELFGIVLVFRDVTEEHSMQEQLRHSQKMDAIGQLAGGVAHDFNNMLSGIMGAAELLAIQSPLDQRTKKLHNMIISTTERAAGLTQKLLSFAKSHEPASSTVDVNKILQDTVAILKSTIDRRIKIILNLEPGHKMVIGDPSELQSSFLNIGINASHAMPDGGTITISSCTKELDAPFCQANTFDLKPGPYLQVEMSDTGCGIEPADLHRIFEPFFTTKGQGKGTGLGLASVFGTVQQHGGCVTVSSTINVGTSFYLFFPLAIGEVPALPSSTHTIKGSGRILVVDDEPIMRVTAQAILEDLGYDVILAEDGQAGLDKFKQDPTGIDLVILDMIMPELNGRDCFLAMIDIAPDVRAVLSSGFSREEDIEEMQLKGLCNFIRKPYRSSTLSQVVHKALKQ